MKRPARLPLITILVIISLEIGAYTYAALQHQERLHILLETAILCLLSIIIAIIVTRPKAQAISSGIITFGVIALGIGLYFLTALNYHERAYIAIGVGILCLIGGFAGIILPRSTIAALSGIVLLGIITLSGGLYFLNILRYDGRAYMFLGTGALCLVGGLIGIIFIQYRSHTAVR